MKLTPNSSFPLAHLPQLEAQPLTSLSQAQAHAKLELDVEEVLGVVQADDHYSDPGRPPLAGRSPLDLVPLLSLMEPKGGVEAGEGAL